MRKTLILIACLMASAVSANLVPNPGFEAGAQGIAAVWNVSEAGTEGQEGAMAYWTSEEVHTGQWALKLEMTEDTGHGFILVVSPQLPVLRGFEYEVSFWYRAESLRPETMDRTHYSALIEDTFIHTAPPIKYLGNRRIIIFNDSPEWQRASKIFKVTEPGAANVQVRLALVPKMPGLKPVVYIDDVSLVPLDASVPNPGAEVGEQQPESWRPIGVGTGTWSEAESHEGSRSLAVADAPAGQPSGWYVDIPCRPDRKYGLQGWIRTERVSPNGTPQGAYMALTFLDAEGTIVGEAARSQALAGDHEWTEVAIEPATAPPGAVFLRLSGEMVFCSGTAWFDDFEVQIAPTEAVAVKRVAREVRGAQAGIVYAENLLPNPTLEEGDNGQAAGWTFVGKPDPDWTEEELDKYYHSGYPAASMGRGRGEWSDLAFSGEHSLMIDPVDPPLSPRSQWYGCMEVDTYWLSEPMPCSPEQAYFTSGWLRVTHDPGDTWHGPLRLFFYDAVGRRINAQLPRPALQLWQPGQWAWHGTAPIVAPDNAATMRLVFGEVLKANQGSFGRMWGDNFAVWALSEEAQQISVPPPFQAEKFKKYFFQAHRTQRPPYSAPPDYVPAGETAFVQIDAPAAGNLFFDPQAQTPLEISVRNLLAEQREFTLDIVRYDWQGNRDALPPLKLTVDGWGETTTKLQAPAPGRFDCFYVEVTVRENGAETGQGAGRYAVLPRPVRQRYLASRSPWCVQPLIHILGDGSAYERELGEMMKIAGYGATIVRFHFSTDASREEIQAQYDKAKPRLDYWHNLGIEICGCIGFPGREAGANLARIFGQDFAAWSVGGVELANHGSPFRATGGMSDEEYDRLVADTVDGIRSVLPEAKIMSGAIATDMEAATLKRWYEGGVGQKFDGFIFNTYMGANLVVQNNLAMMDSYGDTHKTAWIEEIPAHNAPPSGPARRYTEKDAAANMVRTYVSLLSKFGPRFERITAWAFVQKTDTDYSVITSDLSPRPQYQAMVVLSDKFGQADFDADLSSDRLTIYRWRHGLRTLGILWATVGEQSVTLEVPTDSVIVTDLMGNAEEHPVENGLLTVAVTEMPLYLENAGDFTVSRRLQVSLGHARSAMEGPANLQLTLRNNSEQRMAGTVRLSGPVALAPDTVAFDLAPGQELATLVEVKGEPATDHRETYRAVATTEQGATFAAVSNFNFARAAHADTPSALDGTWSGWERAQPLSLSSKEQARPPHIPGESWTGPPDASAVIRLLWDEQYLYLGVEGRDDVFSPFPQRAFAGFSGDSIEFALQPDNILAAEVPRHEFELFLPGGQGQPMLSKRLPWTEITDWTCAVVPTGEGGNINYQVAIPWTALGLSQPASGQVISFSLVLNDVDGETFSGGRAWLHWFGGLAIGKDPSLYGDVILCD